MGRVRNRNAIAIENTADTMDEVRLAEERDLAIQILGRDFADFVSWRQRCPHRGWIYGLCLRCDETIRSNRLRVMPHAAFCVTCQEAAERDGFSELSLPEGATSTVRLSTRKTNPSKRRDSSRTTATCETGAVELPDSRTKLA